MFEQEKVPQQAVETPEREAIIELLFSNVDIASAYAKGQDTFTVIELAETDEEKVEAFIDSPLNEYRTQMEGEKGEFSAEDRELLRSVNDKLNDSSAVKVLLLGEDIWDGVLLSLLEKQLDGKCSDAVVSDEIFHYRSVYRLAKEFFPDNIVLQIAALVHDSHKYDMSGKRQLGLHELASTATAEAITQEALKLVVQRGLIDLSDDEIEVVARAVARATYTHGNDEFPFMLSANTPVEQVQYLYWLWKELYPRPERTSIPTNFAKEPDTLDNAVAGLNLADIFVGSDAPSFKKYNLGWADEILATSSLSDYLLNNIFASFTANFMNSAFFYYAEHANTQNDADVVVNKIKLFKDRAALVQLLLMGDEFSSGQKTEYQRFIQEHPTLEEIAQGVQKMYPPIKPAYEAFMVYEKQLKGLREEYDALLEQKEKIKEDFPNTYADWPTHPKWPEHQQLTDQLTQLLPQYTQVQAEYAQKKQMLELARFNFDQAFGKLIDAVMEEFTESDVLPV